MGTFLDFDDDNDTITNTNNDEFDKTMTSTGTMPSATTSISPNGMIHNDSSISPTTVTTAFCPAPTLSSPYFTETVPSGFCNQVHHDAIENDPFRTETTPSITIPPIDTESTKLLCDDDDDASIFAGLLLNNDDVIVDDSSSVAVVDELLSLDRILGFDTDDIYDDIDIDWM